MISLILSLIGQAHDGILSTLDLEIDEDGNIIALSSWGVFSQEEGRWVWSCSEAFSNPPYPVFALGGGKWHIAGMNGISSSEDGCGATPLSMDEKWVSDLEWFQDELWFTTATGMMQNGIYKYDPINEIQIVFEPNNNSRLFGIGLKNDIGWAVGINENTPQIWVMSEGQWENKTIGGDGDFIDMLGIISNDEVIVQVHLNPTLHDIRKIDSAGNEVHLFQSPSRLSSAIAFDNKLIVGGEDGHYVSYNQGQSWSGPFQRPETACLLQHEDWLYACTHAILDEAAIMKTQAIGDAQEWEWQPVLNFGDVHELRDCSQDSLVMEECPKVWESAKLNGGLDQSDEKVEDAEPMPCGCNNISYAWAFLIPVALRMRTRH